MNLASLGLQAVLNTVSVVWHVLGTIFLVILLPFVAPTHQSANFVFTEFYGVGSEVVMSGLSNNG